jgi:hypothetical protein
MILIKIFNKYILHNYLNLIITTVLLIVTEVICAQSINIKGIVKEVDGTPMIGVEVYEKNTTNGTITEVDGSYSIMVNTQQSILVFNYWGYKKQEVTVGSSKMIDMIMEQDATILDDVIVTGYRKETRSDVSTAISSIKSKDVEKLVVSGVEQALQGQAPGISVTQVTGSPGDDMAVRIRGAGTLGNNNPLFIVDGVPTSGNINMFSVNDIQSIEVLKDGASAAIYG